MKKPVVASAMQILNALKSMQEKGSLKLYPTEHKAAVDVEQYWENRLPEWRKNFRSNIHHYIGAILKKDPSTFALTLVSLQTGEEL